MRTLTVLSALLLIACGSSEPETTTPAPEPETTETEGTSTEAPSTEEGSTGEAAPGPVGHAAEPVFETDALNAQSDAIISRYPDDHCCCEFVVQGDIVQEDLLEVSDCTQSRGGRCVRINPLRIAPHTCCPERGEGERCNGESS